MDTLLTPTIAYFGTQEILIVGAIVLVLFGGTKIPQLAKGFGEGIREFKKSVNAEGDTPNSGDGPTPTRAADDVTVVKTIKG